MAHRLFALFGLAMLLICGALPTHASAIPYTITYSFYAGSSAPPSLPTGGFGYDAAAPLASRFSNFLVNWYGHTFDLTASANSPLLLTVPSASCFPTNDSAGAFFALTHSMGCAPLGVGTNFWKADASKFGSEFAFIIGNLSTSDQIEFGDYSGPPILPQTPLVEGGYLVTQFFPNGQAPEPASQIMLMIGALAILGTKKMHTRRTG